MNQPCDSSCDSYQPTNPSPMLAVALIPASMPEATVAQLTFESGPAHLWFQFIRMRRTIHLYFRPLPLLLAITSHSDFISSCVQYIHFSPLGSKGADSGPPFPNQALPSAKILGGLEGSNVAPHHFSLDRITWPFTVQSNHGLKIGSYAPVGHKHESTHTQLSV
jgi:hypothetical protein